MKPTHHEVKTFDHKRNHKFLMEARAENDRSAFAWLLDWRAQLSIVLVFGTLGACNLYTGNTAIGWVFLGITFILTSAFMVFRVLVPFCKWLVNLVD